MSPSESRGIQCIAQPVNTILTTFRAVKNSKAYKIYYIYSSAFILCETVSTTFVILNRSFLFGLSVLSQNPKVIFLGWFGECQEISPLSNCRKRGAKALRRTAQQSRTNILRTKTHTSALTTTLVTLIIPVFPPIEFLPLFS
jgi:hypothetical protein